MWLLAASLFFSNPAPLDMPRAEAYFVKEDGCLRLEDRFNKGDLWITRSVLGRWLDDDGRVFTLCRLDTLPPAVETEATVTRMDYLAGAAPLEPKNLRGLRRAVEVLSPCELPEACASPRQVIRGFKEVGYWQGTNVTALVCTFLPERERCWYLAVWELCDGDEPEASLEAFERKFLGCWDSFGWLCKGGATKPTSEREALRQDAHHSVTNYTDWHWTDAPEFTVLDALPKGSGFVSALTNELRTMRAQYAATLPTRIDGSNVLCIARLFGTRDDYLSAVGEELKWSAAVWDVARRELSAYLPPSGERELMKTIRHEAFHQYLSYACSMITVSPWLNEGYAVYFEDQDQTDWEEGRRPGPDELERLAALIPSLLKMDYEEFYAGSDEDRRLKYRLAWSLAVFLEKGAPKVRFDPFKTVKKTYLDTLVETRDMTRATEAAFRGPEFLQKFVSEWLKFWKNT